MSDKQLILNTVQNIAEGTSYEEILYTLYLQLEIQKGIKDMEEGKFSFYLLGLILAGKFIFSVNVTSLL